MPDFIGFVDGAYEAASIYQDTQQLINWYPEVDPMKQPGERGVKALYPTPGLLLKIALPAAAEVRGFFVLPGGQSMLCVCGPTLYLIVAALTYTNVGTLSTSSGQVSMDYNGIQVLIADGVNRYAYNVVSNIFAAAPITDGAFQGADKCYFVDGFFVYNKPNSNLWGASNALAATSSNVSFGQKGSTADNIVTMIVNKREVLLIGEQTTERWINVGAFPFPFQIIPGSSLQHGCIAKHSVAKLGESVAWLSNDTRGQAIVILMVGYNPTRISTHAIENDINTGVLSDAIAYTYQQEGHEFYVLTLPTQDKTWVYDITTQLWHKRAYRDNLNILHRHLSNCACVFQGMNLVGDYQNGNIYALSATTYTDNGKPIQRLRRAPHVTEDLMRVTHDSLQVQFQPGVGLSTGQGSAPNMMLRWSDDGASTWSSYYNIPIGQIGQYKNRAIKRKLGWARDRVYEVSITDPVKAVIISAELSISVGTS